MIAPLNPILLWGGALVAVPIVIHLLFRRRYRRVRWAAMEFLLDAMRRTRRRLQLEHLIILMLRCLAILLIALLVARLVVDPRALRLGAGTAAEHILLIDDSPGMGLRNRDRTLLAEALAGAAELVRHLGRERPGDRCTVVLASRPETPVVNGAFLNGDAPETIARRLETVSPSAFPAAFETLLDKVTDNHLAQPATGTRTCYLVSDFRAHDWAGPEGTTATWVPRALSRLVNHTDRLVLSDLGAAIGPNCAVTAITSLEPNLVAGIPARFAITLRNHGDRITPTIPVHCAVRDATPVTVTADPIPPGASATVNVTLTVAHPGSTGISATLQHHDPLPADDAAFLAVTVRPAIAALVGGGAPHPRAHPDRKVEQPPPPSTTSPNRSTSPARSHPPATSTPASAPPSSTKPTSPAATSPRFMPSCCSTTTSCRPSGPAPWPTGSTPAAA